MSTPSPAFVPLDRRFAKIEKGNKERYDWASVLQGWSGFGDPWSTLLPKWRVVILAEGGMGKTRELKAKAVELTNSGIPAFFIRLEDLLTLSLREAIESSNDQERLDAWLRAGGEAYLFLDSVDEARLRTKSGFAQALKKLRSDIGEAALRAHLFVTSRPYPDWCDEEDRILLAEIFPAPTSTARSKGIEGSAGADQAIEVSTTDQNAPLVVQLLPLDHERAGQFARAELRESATQFLDAVQRANAGRMLSRPKDVLDVIAHWKDTGRIGSYREVLDSTADRRLRESTERDEARPLDPLTAYSGAERLAAALTLCRRASVVAADASAEAKLAGLDAAEALPSWDSRSLHALLTRPIFEIESFEQLRFSQSDLRGYLYAKWLKSLLKREAPFETIRDLLIANRYGIKTVMPYVAESAAWLAQMDDRFRAEILQIEPELLIQAGDPSELPITTRAELLRRYVARYEGRPDAHLSVDIKMVQQLAAPELEKTIVDYLVAFRSNPAIRELMFRLCWQGRFRSAIPEAIATAMNPRAERYQRILGMRCIDATDDQTARRKLASDLKKRLGNYTGEAGREALATCFPKVFTAEEFASVIELLDPPKRFSVGLNYTVEQIAKNLEDADQAFELLQTLSRLITKGPYVEHLHVSLSVRYAYLLTAVDDLVLKLLPLPKYHDNPVVLNAVEVLLAGSAFMADPRTHADDIRKQLATLPAVRLKLFWRTVGRQRERLGSARDTLRDFWRVREYGEAWWFEKEDIPLLSPALRAGDRADRELVLTIVHELRRKHPDSVSLEDLKREIGDQPSLLARLEELERPIPKSPELVALEKQQEKYRKRAAKQEAEQQRQERAFIEEMQGKGATLGDPDRARTKEGFHDLLRITDWLLENTNSVSRYSELDIAKGTEVFGQECISGYLDGIAAYWRHYKTTLVSEGQAGNQTSYGTVVSLNGITAESRADPLWHQKLSEEEAEFAVRHALAEMNGFPPWFEALVTSHPDTARKIVAQELAWEWSNPSDNAPHYVLSDLVYAQDSVQAIFSPTVLSLLMQKSPAHQETLSHALNLISVTPEGRSKEFVSFCRGRATQKGIVQEKTSWVAAWIQADSRSALKWLDQTLSREPNPRRAATFFLLVLSSLYNERSRSLSKIDAIEQKDIDQLALIVRLCFRYIRPEEDIEHDGVYSPGDRDRAEDARRYFLEQLLKVPGERAFLLLQELAEERNTFPPYLCESFRDHAVVRAAADGEPRAWSAAEVVEFCNKFECAPRNMEELFNLVRARLKDIQYDLDHGDFSERDIVRSFKLERDAQRWFASRLRERSGDIYSVTREEEVVDAKETDIRIHKPDIGTLTIEVKLADKWAFPKLREGYESQLIGRYLRDRRGKAGIYLLVHRGITRHSWIVGRRKVGLASVRDVLKKSPKAPQGTFVDIYAVDVSSPAKTQKITRQKRQKSGSRVRAKRGTKSRR